MPALKRGAVDPEPDDEDDGGPLYIAVTTETRKRRKVELEGMVLDIDSSQLAEGAEFFFVARTTKFMFLCF